MNIKYIAFYDIDEYEFENRVNPLSARNVSDYIVKKLISEGHNVEIVSPSETKLRKGYYKSRSNLYDGVRVTLGPTWGTQNKYLRSFFSLLTRAWFLVYLLVNVKSSDVIILWHQIPAMELIMLFRLITHKRNEFILCVGEIYQKVIPNMISERRKKRELKFISSADKYILSTLGIKKYVNIENRPIVELPGMLNTLANRKRIFNDSRIHILYSGVINSTKGAFEAVDMMDYLDDRYVLHILGWGQDIDSIDRLIDHINSKHDHKKIVYEGIKRGGEYEDYLLSCDIGLCSQDQNVAYNDCSFPSKILTYLCANIKVICTNIPAVKESAVADMIYFVDSNSPFELAEAVRKVSFLPAPDTRIKMGELDDVIERELNSLIVKR